jgi:hypothetical protein
MTPTFHTPIKAIAVKNKLIGTPCLVAKPSKPLTSQGEIDPAKTRTVARKAAIAHVTALMAAGQFPEFFMPAASLTPTQTLKAIKSRTVLPLPQPSTGRIDADLRWLTTLRNLLQSSRGARFIDNS